jgi:hypothetical protein
MTNLISQSAKLEGISQETVNYMSANLDSSADL